MVISNEVSQPSINVIGLKSNHLKFNSNHPGHNEFRNQQPLFTVQKFPLSCLNIAYMCVVVFLEAASGGVLAAAEDELTKHYMWYS